MTITSRGVGVSITTRSMALARAKAATAGSFQFCSRSSCSSHGSGQRMCSPPGGIANSGTTICRALASASTEAELSMISAVVLKPDPAAGEPAHGETEQAEIQGVLHAGRVQHRHRGVEERELALVRHRRGLGDMVVAGDRQDAAPGRGAGEVRVLEHVPRPVDARALAVPDAEHAVVVGAGEQVGLLAAPDGGRRQFLVHARLEVHVMLLQQLARAPQLLVVAAERRTAVTRDEAAGVLAEREIAAALDQRQPHQRLHAGQEDPPTIEDVLVVE